MLGSSPEEAAVRSFLTDDFLELLGIRFSEHEPEPIPDISIDCFES
ncbi:hypothetical protein FACS1894164_21270 [Spirochaetia bacterium]|nr:hypothetical protein FACS1894164_21270 [Spirochaetia bacterium]